MERSCPDPSSAEYAARVTQAVVWFQQDIRKVLTGLNCLIMDAENLRDWTDSGTDLDLPQGEIKDAEAALLDIERQMRGVERIADLLAARHSSRVDAVLARDAAGGAA